MKQMQQHERKPSRLVGVPSVKRRLPRSGNRRKQQRQQRRQQQKQTLPLLATMRTRMVHLVMAQLPTLTQTLVLVVTWMKQPWPRLPLRKQSWRARSERLVPSERGKHERRRD